MKRLLAVALLCGLVTSITKAADDSFDSNGVKIRYVTEGQGEAVVLIHGWMADSSMWGQDRKGNTKLKGLDGFMVVALDCRGHGKSDKPHDASKYDAEVAQDIVRLLDHLKIKKAHLIGYSSGSFIAGKVAALHPERVLSIVFAGQAPIIGEPKPGDFSEVEAFADAVEKGPDLGAYIIAVTPADKPKPTPEQAKFLAQLMFNGKDVKAFATAGRGYPKLAVTAEELKKCEVPILFVHGANESAHVKNKVAAARKILDRSEYKIIDGADHMTTLAKPDFGTTLVEFLNKVKRK